MTQHRLIAWAWGLLLVLGYAADASGQLPDLKWHKGPATVSIGTVAQIQMPAGYWCINDPVSVRRFYELNGNPYQAALLAMIIPDLQRTTDDFWFMVCSFHAIGYVSDDEKGYLLKDEVKAALLDEICKGTEESNAERRRRGWPTLTIEGWQTSPHFDDYTKNLTWATISRDSTGERSVNYDSRLLGRQGVLSIKLVTDPQKLSLQIPIYQNLVSRISFTSGNKHSEFRQGDRIAQYGLTGLISGGTTVIVARNWRRFVGFGAAILAALGALGAWIKKQLSGTGGIEATPATAGAAATAADDAPSAGSDVRQCSICGQKNRLRPGGKDPVCGRCGAKLS